MKPRVGTSVLLPLLLALLFGGLACGGDEEPASRDAGGDRPGAPVDVAVPEAPPPAPRELPGGLVVETLRTGRGPAARNGDRITMHFEGKVTESGEVFETTQASGIPLSFTLGERAVIHAFDLGLDGAHAGEELKLTVPAALAYGSEGFGRVPPDADLEFLVRVVDVE